jgi:hypothetical protein
LSAVPYRLVAKHGVVDARIDALVLNYVERHNVVRSYFGHVPAEFNRGKPCEWDAHIGPARFHFHRIKIPNQGEAL